MSDEKKKPKLPSEIRNKPIRMFNVVALAALLTACGENSEEAYERGYEDGIDEVCGDVYSFSVRIFNTLRSKNIC